MKKMRFLLFRKIKYKLYDSQTIGKKIKFANPVND